MSDASAWNRVIDDLARWHDAHDRGAVERALVFVEEELRATLPASVRRRWPPDLVDEAVGDVLRYLFQQRLRADVTNPRAYVATMLRNRGITIERARGRRAGEPLDENVAAPEVPADRSDAAELLERMTVALAELPIEDRVALKMEDAPHAMTWDELRWLSSRCGVAPESLRDRLVACPEVYELTLLFDPGLASTDREERRRRMERFRKRRGRARDELRARLGREQ